MSPPRRLLPPPLRALAAAALAVSFSLAAAPPESSSEEIYRLGKEALARASFETAARLFRLLEGEARFDTDARYAFNRAQASRYSASPAEAIYFYARYLSLAPAASDAASVRAEMAKLEKASPGALRVEAARRARAEYVRLRNDAELSRALDDCARVRLGVRFRRTNAQAGEPTTYLHHGRAVFFELATEAGAPPAVWVSTDDAVTGPDESPPLLFIPPGRPFRVPLSSDGPPTVVVPPPPAGFRADPASSEWAIEVTAELDRNGPALLLTGALPGEVMIEVRSGPFDGPLLLGKKRRELPSIATPLAFGPRAAPADAKVHAGERLFVIDLQGKEGSEQRWGAPARDFAIVNGFGKLVAGAAGPERIAVRADGQGPFLVPLAIAAR